MPKPTARRVQSRGLNPHLLPPKAKVFLPADDKVARERVGRKMPLRYLENDVCLETLSLNKDVEDGAPSKPRDRCKAGNHKFPHLDCEEPRTRDSDRRPHFTPPEGAPGSACQVYLRSSMPPSPPHSLARSFPGKEGLGTPPGPGACSMG